MPGSAPAGEGVTFATSNWVAIMSSGRMRTGNCSGFDRSALLDSLLLLIRELAGLRESDRVQDFEQSGEADRRPSPMENDHAREDDRRNGGWNPFYRPDKTRHLSRNQLRCLHG
jgi:hypothetical protein